MSYTIEDFARDHNITSEENAHAVAQLRQDMRLYELREACAIGMALELGNRIVRYKYPHEQK